VNELLGIHHVTAVTGRATDNVRFYRDLLGLRMVKKTVNQDMVSAYHLFYADAKGSPGTDITFFDWPNIADNVNGTGEVARTTFIVPDSAQLDWWADRLKENGVPVGEVEEHGGRQLLPFQDLEGQRLGLVAQTSNDSTPAVQAIPWETPHITEAHALRGMGHITITVANGDSTTRFLTERMAFEVDRQYADPQNPALQTVVLKTGRGGLGAEVHIQEHPDLPRAMTGIGGVHHVAFRTPDDSTIQEWRDRLAEDRVAVTPVIDRYYFKSIYFREPGGVLYEIATDGPGFAADEDSEHLGESLSLPPFLEPRRQEIEASLIPLDV
jgi:glyoxalase family protein